MLDKVVLEAASLSMAEYLGEIDNSSTDIDHLTCAAAVFDM